MGWLIEILFVISVIVVVVYETRQNYCDDCGHRLKKKDKDLFICTHCGRKWKYISGDWCRWG